LVALALSAPPFSLRLNAPVQRGCPTPNDEEETMPRFDCEATISFSYVVTAASKDEAETLLAEQLGADWEDQVGQPDNIEHPQIEQGAYGTDISCLGPEGEL
jgi:hypothetical protein